MSSKTPALLHLRPTPVYHALPPFSFIEPAQYTIIYWCIYFLIVYLSPLKVCFPAYRPPEGRDLVPFFISVFPAPSRVRAPRRHTASDSWMNKWKDPSPPPPHILRRLWTLSPHLPGPDPLPSAVVCGLSWGRSHRPWPQGSLVLQGEEAHLLTQRLRSVPAGGSTSTEAGRGHFRLCEELRLRATNLSEVTQIARGRTRIQSSLIPTPVLISLYRGLGRRAGI